MNVVIIKEFFCVGASEFETLTISGPEPQNGINSINDYINQHYPNYVISSMTTTTMEKTLMGIINTYVLTKLT